MTNQLIPFQFGDFSIRVVMQDDQPWWVASDVCAALDIGNVTMALSRLDEDEKSQVIDPATLNSTEGTRINNLLNIINEPGLYSLILGSRKPEAKVFKRWVTHDILPALRKTGSYSMPNTKQIPTPDTISLKHRQAKAIASTYLYVAKLFGTDKPMAIAVAADMVKKQTGVDLQPLLAGNVIAEKPMTPTDLGKLRGWSARGTNLQLMLAGLQAKNEHDEWMPTEHGRAYCTCNPYKSPNSDHTGYRVLWYKSALDLLPERTREQEAA